MKPKTAQEALGQYQKLAKDYSLQTLTRIRKPLKGADHTDRELRRVRYMLLKAYRLERDEWRRRGARCTLSGVVHEAAH